MFEVESWSGDAGALWEIWECPFCRVCGLLFGLEKVQIEPFAPCTVEQPLRGMELQEKEAQKD